MKERRRNPQKIDVPQYPFKAIISLGLAFVFFGIMLVYTYISEHHPELNPYSQAGHQQGLINQQKVSGNWSHDHGF